MKNLIELKNVTKRFGGITALNKASLNVGSGEVVGLIGDNGAGKSTLIKTLVGVYSPDEGDIFIKDKKVEGWTALKAREAGIEVEGIMTSGGKKQWKWLLRCIGCRRTEEGSTDAHRSKKDDVKLCDRCGSPMKLKRA